MNCDCRPSTSLTFLTTPRMRRVHNRVRGPVAAERDGVPIPLGGPQQRGLLGVLLSRRAQVVAVSTLVEAPTGKLALTDLASRPANRDTAPSSRTEVRQAGLRLGRTVQGYGGGPDAPIKVTDLRPESWVTAACSLAGRNLTKEEWGDTVGDVVPFRATCSQFKPSG